MKNIVATMLARPVDSTPLSMSEPKKSTDVTAGSAPKHHDCKSRKIPSTCIIGADTQEQLFALSSRVSSDNHRYRSNTQFLHPPFPFENKTTSLPPSPSHPVRPPRPMSLDLGVLYPAMPTVVCQHKIRKSKNIQKSYRNVINIIKRGAKVEVAVFSKDSEERKGGPMAKKHKSQKTFGFGSVSQSMMRAKSKAEQAFLNRFRFPTSSASSQASSSSSSINMDTSEIHRVEMISGSSDALPQKRTHIPSFIAYRNPDEDFKQIKRNTPCFCHLLYPHPIKNVDIFNERREILALPGTNAAREPLRIRLFI
ncbi:hypothetical protein BGZ46_007623 [Entomortierella lignicola]|nr:hypothetical protein BGZ46_007623 [Entomortierella lignicola]